MTAVARCSNSRGCGALQGPGVERSGICHVRGHWSDVQPGICACHCDIGARFDSPSDTNRLSTRVAAGMQQTEPWAHTTAQLIVPLGGSGMGAAIRRQLRSDAVRRGDRTYQRSSDVR